MLERAPLPEAWDRPRPGRALVLAPHADDDVLGCGGTAALHVRQGDEVRVVIVFDGLLGDPERRYDAEKLRMLRQREARAGGAHLGLSDYAFWGYPEGHAPPADELRAAAERIAAEVASFRPATVYAPWIGEHHLDHNTVARVARAGLELAGFAGEAWGYEVWTPLIATVVIDVTSVWDAKVAALREHRSQLEYTDHVHMALGLNAHRSLYLRRGARYGEAFRPLGPALAEDRRTVGLASAEGAAR